MKKINSIIKKNKVLLSNFGYLSILQIATIVLPFLTYPYLIKVMGLDIWGKLVLAQISVSYVIIIVNLGFDTVATKYISLSKGENMKINRIVADVYAVKFIIFIVLAILYYIIISNLGLNSGDMKMMVYSYFLCIPELILPVWYFQGIEKMRNIAITNVISKVILVFVIFHYINSSEQYYLVPLFNSIGGIVGGVISIKLLLNNNVKFTRPKMSRMWVLFREGCAICINRLLISLKNRLNIFIIAGLLGPVSVAIFDIAIKFINVYTSFINVICRTVFPKYSRDKSKIFITKILLISFFTVVLLLSINIFFMDDIMTYLINDVKFEDVLFIKFVIISVPFMTIGNILAMVVLNGNSEYKSILKGTFLTLAAYAFILIVGYLLGYIYNLYFYGFIVFILYFIEFIYRFFVCKKKKYI